MRSVFFCAVVGLLCGCTATYQKSDLISASERLEKNAGVFISVPRDGVYERTTYKSSGIMTANEIMKSFNKYSDAVTVSDKCQDEDCFGQIDKDKYVYYVLPRILHWEERATEWSGKPDRIEVMLSLYDVASQKKLSSVSLKGKSKWATFGGDHPQDLLPEPIGKYVDSLYQ